MVEANKRFDGLEMLHAGTFHFSRVNLPVDVLYLYLIFTGAESTYITFSEKESHPDYYYIFDARQDLSWSLMGFKRTTNHQYHHCKG
jgi:hypothetical protein